MVTSDNFVSMLAQDPALLFRTIIANNPKAVQGNINAAHLTSSNQQLNDPFTILMNMYSRGRYAEVARIIAVPYLPGTLPPGYDEFFRDVAFQHQPQLRSTNGSGSWWTEMDWGGIIDGIGGIVGQFTDEPGSGGGGTGPGPAPTPAPAPAPDNTVLYISLAGGAIALALIVYLATRH